MRDSEKAILHILTTLPFYKGGEDSTLIIGADNFLSCEARIYSPYSPLDTKSIQPHASEWQGAFKNILVIGTKQKQETAYFLALALKCAAQDACVIVALENNWGGKSLDKLFNEAFLTAHTASKHKSRVVWTVLPQDIAPEITHKWLEEGGLHQRPDGQWTQAGIFSWEKMDRGTSVFMKYFEAPLKGDGADFGCGCGDLSKFILENNQGVSTLHLLDIDSRAVTCAARNLNAYKEKINPICCNITQDPLPKNLDFIVMNPPFHTGKDQQITLGQAFITQAVKSLKAGGIVGVVANVHLPYEELLRENFRTVKTIAIEDGFKVMTAQK
ncbi:MAG: methyltransferase [Pseudobdellovibrionaceae bacterium]|jgi:16S rRNA (guanine1207-N2)-methyltransferase|nr:methyltransferase [Pseudobdellovibrionaceae bacterium]